MERHVVAAPAHVRIVLDGAGPHSAHRPVAPGSFGAERVTA